MEPLISVKDFFKKNLPYDIFNEISYNTNEYDELLKDFNDRKKKRINDYCLKIFGIPQSHVNIKHISSLSKEAFDEFNEFLSVKQESPVLKYISREKESSLRVDFKKTFGFANKCFSSIFLNTETCVESIDEIIPNWLSENINDDDWYNITIDENELNIFDQLISYRVLSVKILQTFYFTRETDAILFKLKFG